jgi:hypothetical protein
MRDRFDYTRARTVPGEHVRTNGSPRIGTPYNQFGRSSLYFVEKAVVYEQNLDGWEFGKGALSANYIFSTITPW